MHSFYRHALGAALLAGLFALPSLAAAADAAVSDADKLFRTGRKAAESGDYETACRAFADSFALDAAPGTLLNLGDCEEHRRHIADALGHYENALSRMPAKDDRIAIAKERVAALLARVAKLTVRAQPGAPANTFISLDGAALDRAKFGVPLRMNPGAHELVATAVGHRGEKKQVVLPEGASQEVAIAPGEALEPIPVEPGANPAKMEERRSSPWRTVGWISGGVGLAGLWAGSVTGLLAIDRESTRSKHCDAQKLCDQTGLDAAKSGNSLATMSTIGMGVGIVGLAAGIVLIVTSPGEKSETKPSTALAPTALPGGGGLTLFRSF